MNDTEESFRRHLWFQSEIHVRVAFLAAAVLFPLLWTWDWLVDPQGARVTWTLRLGATAVFLSFYLLFRRVGGLRRHPGATWATAVLLGTLILLAIFLSLADGYVAGQAGLLLVVVVVAVVGPSARAAVSLSLAVVLVAGGGVAAGHLLGWEAPGLPSPRTAGAIFLIQLSAVGVVGALARMDEHRDRNAFLLREELGRQAAVDPLTRLMNRRGLEAVFRRETARHRRHRRPLGLLLLDLDRFKAVNDAHGHGVGDRVLAEMAHRWQDALRAGGSLARVGGEEFLALVPEADRDGIVEAAERLRAASQERPVEVEGSSLDVTVSVGATLILPGGQKEELDQVIRRVDRALYRAKEGGRNRVEFEAPEND